MENFVNPAGEFTKSDIQTQKSNPTCKEFVNRLIYCTFVDNADVSSSEYVLYTYKFHK